MPGVELVIDHRTAWIKSRDTSFENLQTLCRECNGGKGDLDEDE
jgi:5-methylcytosine-specific restriction endonuclease McrA